MAHFRSILVALAVAFYLLPTATIAAPQTLNFDDVDHATNITSTHYANQGALLEGTTFPNGIPIIGHYTICPNNYREQNDYAFQPYTAFLEIPADTVAYKGPSGDIIYLKKPLPGSFFLFAQVPPGYVEYTPPPPLPKPANQNMWAVDIDRPNVLRFTGGQTTDIISFRVINENGAATLYEAFDPSGNLITSGQVEGNPCEGAPISISKGSSVGINAVRFTRIGSGNRYFPGPGFIGIDDVTYDLTPAPAPTPVSPPIVVAPLPEPGAFSGTAVASCNGSNSLVTLNWTPSSNADVYRVYDIAASNPAGAVQLATLPASVHTYVVTALQTTLNYVVAAGNNSGVTSITLTTSVPNCAPQASIALDPVLSICSNTAPQNRLRWTSSDGSADALSDFHIFRNGTEIGATTEHSYVDTAPTPSTSYAYEIRSGNTTSDTENVLTTSCPQPPGPLTISAATPCQDTIPMNQLTWTASTNATRYEINRNGQPYATINAPQTTYTDAAVTTGVSYSYILTAFNAVGVSVSSPILVTAANCAPAPVQAPPVANDDSAETGPTTPVTVPVLTNDIDPDNNLDPSSLRITQNPANGVAIVASTQGITYTPNAGFSGTDTLTYEVCDTTNLCDTALVTITVTATPPPPPVLPGAFTLSFQGICAGSSAQHVLTWTASSDALRYTLRRNGQPLTTTTTTSFTDTSPVAGTNYTYVVDAMNDDGTTVSSPIQATTTNCAPVTPVTPTPAVNQPPVASDDTATTRQGQAVTIDVLANDVDPDGQVNPSCTTVLTQPTNGTTTVNTATGQVVYTPAANFSGTDTFIYEMCDNQGLTDTAAVTVVVQAPPPTPTATNAPPQANDDAGTTPFNQPVIIDILGNDIDPDNNLDRSCTKVTRQPGHGTVTINAESGRATYTPTTGYSGTDSFEYSICDAAGLTDTATVTIAVGQAPPTTLASTGIPIFGFLIDLWNQLLTLIGLR